MIKILILGAGGAVPTPSHCPAAYWVTIDQRRILLDPGPGALVRLVKSAHAPDSVDAIDTVLLSHLHIDHCADLVPLLFALHSPIPASTEPLTVIGPRGLAEYFSRLHDIYGRWLDPRKRRLNILEISPGDVLRPAADSTGSWQIDAAENTDRETPAVCAFAADHPQDVLSETGLVYRFQDQQGNHLVFSGDTGPSDGLTTASRDADLLVVECSTSDQQELVGHMSPRRVGNLCTEADVRRVVLTHQYPEAAELDLPSLVGLYYAGPIIAARDDSLFVVPEAAGIPKEHP